MAFISLNDNKAGMEGLDKEKINSIIIEASKGSKFYENETRKEEKMKERLNAQSLALSQAPPADLDACMRSADAIFDRLRDDLDLSRPIVHVDMDAFYAAVEMRDRPKLKNMPMAVGGEGMLSTSNYVARRFGVRAAMPGFIARKLCPQLIITPVDFPKYRAVSAQIREIMTVYHPRFSPMSLDEAYLDFTDHLTEREDSSAESRTFLTIPDSERHCMCEPLAQQLDELKNCTKCTKCNKEMNRTTETFGVDTPEAVREMRHRIHLKTRLTASAGIAPNCMLAKICSDKNKPNGQYLLEFTEKAVRDFMQDLPIRKVCGIGKVQERLLSGLGVQKCSDLYTKRASIGFLFSEGSLEHYLSVSMGLGSNVVERNDDPPKSKSVERTFTEKKKPSDLYATCRELCVELAEDLKNAELKGKTITLKLKLVTFKTKTRARSLSSPVSDLEGLYNVARTLLEKEIAAAAPAPLRLRLMGVRMSSFGETDTVQPSRNQPTIQHLLSSSAALIRSTRTDNTDKTAAEPAEPSSPIVITDSGSSTQTSVPDLSSISDEEDGLSKEDGNNGEITANNEETVNGSDDKIDWDIDDEIANKNDDETATDNDDETANDNEDESVNDNDDDEIDNDSGDKIDWDIDDSLGAEVEANGLRSGSEAAQSLHDSSDCFDDKEDNKSNEGGGDTRTDLDLPGSKNDEAGAVKMEADIELSSDNSSTKDHGDCDPDISALIDKATENVLGGDEFIQHIHGGPDSCGASRNEPVHSFFDSVDEENSKSAEDALPSKRRKLQEITRPIDKVRCTDGAKTSVHSRRDDLSIQPSSSVNQTEAASGFTRTSTTLKKKSHGKRPRKCDDSIDELGDSCNEGGDIIRGDDKDDNGGDDKDDDNGGDDNGGDDVAIVISDGDSIPSLSQSGNSKKVSTGIGMTSVKTKTSSSRNDASVHEGDGGEEDTDLYVVKQQSICRYCAKKINADLEGFKRHTEGCLKESCRREAKSAQQRNRTRQRGRGKGGKSSKGHSRSGRSARR